MEQEATISINNNTYTIKSLPTELQEIISTYKIWESELPIARREALKIEAAIRALGVEITTRFEQLEAAASVIRASHVETESHSTPDDSVA